VFFVNFSFAQKVFGSEQLGELRDNFLAALALYAFVLATMNGRSGR
jgi:hypothetical protein